MSWVAPLVRLARAVTDPVAVFSFNGIGFAMNRRGFEAERPPRDGAGRVALVTGANSGIGLATSFELARRGFELWMLCRDPARGKQARGAVARVGGEERVHLAIVDMASQQSIRRFAAEFPRHRVDVLVHNAGVLPQHKQLTEDGVELTFATNVLGPFALTALLFDRLSGSSDARVVFVASGGLYLQRLDPALPEVAAARFDGTRAYANAKRAQIILAHLLAERFGQARVTFASMHPGWADTNAVRTSLPRFHAVMRTLLRTAEQGADTVVWLATSDRPRGSRGQFWFDRRVACEYPLPWTRESAGAREELLRSCEQRSGITLDGAGRHARGGMSS